MNELKLYTDGGIIGKNPSRDGGTWAWALVNHQGEMVDHESGYLSVKEADRKNAEISDSYDDKVSVLGNNTMEFYALLRGLMKLRDDNYVHILSDSNNTIMRCRGVFAKWNGVPIWMLEEFWRQKERLQWWSTFKWTLLDGHPTLLQLSEGRGKRGQPVSKWNVWCDKACAEAAKQYFKDLSK